MLSIKNRLEIILITYNRFEHLQNTLQQLFAHDSPIRDYPITILDNRSTDGSSELIQDYCKKFSNLNHIRHNRNIGGNGNITRAFEIASKEYVWVLCDDDEFDFTHWNDVEDAMQEGYDGIVVSNYINPKDNIAQLVCQMTFVPSTIYKTKHFSDTVMVNAEFSIAFMFPHLAFATKLINDNLRIKILDNWIVNMVSHCGEESYTRGMDNNKHPLMANMYWQIGFLQSLHMIHDNAVKREIIETMAMPGWPAGKFLKEELMLEHNKILGQNSPWNATTIRANLAMFNEQGVENLSKPVWGISKYEDDFYLFWGDLNKKCKIWNKNWFSIKIRSTGYYVIFNGVRIKVFPYIKIEKGSRGYYLRFAGIRIKVFPRTRKH